MPGDILDLNQAVPSWPPPEVVLRAAAEAGGSPEGARYTEDAGLGELRAAVARHLAGRHGARIEPGEVLICAGANMGFSILAQALCSTERRVHLVTPYYFNHPMAVQLAGGAVCERRLPAGLSLGEAVEGGLLEARAGEMILLVNPSNPSGRTHSREDVGALLEHARTSGAFFAYLRHPFEQGSQSVAEQLVREERVFVLPGACCGAGEEGHLRVAVGNADEAALRTAAERMGRLARRA